MHFSDTFPFRRFVAVLACFWVSLLTYAQSQEISSIVNDRVESADMNVPNLTNDQQRRGGLKLGVIVSAAYNTNTFLSRDNPVPDSVFRVGPSISYTQGDSKEGEGGYIQLAYQPTGVIYGKSKSNNRIDQIAALAAGWRGKSSKVTCMGIARQLGDAIPDTGVRSDRVELESELRAAWTVREKISLEVAAGGSSDKFENPDLVSSGRIYGEVALRYAYSPKTQLGLAYRAGQLKIENSDDQATQQLSGSIDWQPREKIFVKLEGGAEMRRFDGGTKTNPIVKARIEWQPRQETKLFLTAYQRNEVSALNQGQVFNVKGITAGISQRLGSKWTAKLETGFEKATYFAVQSNGLSARNDEGWFVNPSLTYLISDQCNVSLFHRTSSNTSSDQNFGFDDALTGLELNYQF
jgi:Putative beta-barrel porin 2